MRVTAYLVDAFTKTAGLGNRAGVVLDASKLAPGQMQDIARLVNVSETAFVLPAMENGYDLQVRYFTPTMEVPICGHATIATHFLRAKKLRLPVSQIKVKTGAGILPVHIEDRDNETWVTMTQGAPSLKKPLESSVCDDIVAALGITGDDMRPGLPIQVASTGHSKVMVPLKHKAVVDSLNPDLPALAKISERIGCNGFFTFAMDTDNKDLLLAGRMFAPAIGLNEDPVTGNANGPAGLYLHAYNLLPGNGRQNGKVIFRALQGEALGKPGVIEVSVHLNAGFVQKIQIAGTAVIAGSQKFSCNGLRVTPVR